MPDEIQPEPDAQAVQEITRRLNDITKRANRAKRRFIIRMSVASVCVLLGMSAVRDLVNFPSPLYYLLLKCLLAGEFVALALLLIVWVHEAPKFNAEEIAHLSGVQAIPSLFAALQTPILLQQHRAIQDALVLLLPQMKASDAHLLTPLAKQMIKTWLTNTIQEHPLHRRPVALCIATLKALEQVGGSSEIHIVGRVGLINPRTPELAQLKQAAVECLPMIVAHCEDIETARTLLRASHAQDARPDTLLRPASHSPETNPAELLRGSEPPETQE